MPHSNSFEPKFQVANNNILLPHIQCAFIRKIRVTMNCIPPFLYLKGNQYEFYPEGFSVDPYSEEEKEVLVSYQMHKDGKRIAVGRIYDASKSSSKTISTF